MLAPQTVMKDATPARLFNLRMSSINDSIDKPPHGASRVPCHVATSLLCTLFVVREADRVPMETQPPAWHIQVHHDISNGWTATQEKL